MDFSIFTNVGLVLAIIVLIQTLKKMLESKDIMFSKNMWKIIVLILGIPTGFLAFGIEAGFENFNLFRLISYCIIYPGCAVLVYQTGKMTLESLMEFLKENAKRKS